MRLLTALSVLPLAGCSWIDEDRISSDFHATVANAPATIQVNNAVGSIDIEAWDKPSVEINATKRGPNYDTSTPSRSRLSHIGSTLTVNTQFPTKSNNAKWSIRSTRRRTPTSNSC